MSQGQRKRFKCKQCHRSYLQARSLNSHVRNKHEGKQDGRNSTSEEEDSEIEAVDEEEQLDVFLLKTSKAQKKVKKENKVKTKVKVEKEVEIETDKENLMKLNKDQLKLEDSEKSDGEPEQSAVDLNTFLIENEQKGTGRRTVKPDYPYFLLMQQPQIPTMANPNSQMKLDDFLYNTVKEVILRSFISEKSAVSVENEGTRGFVDMRMFEEGSRGYKEPIKLSELIPNNSEASVNKES